MITSQTKQQQQNSGNFSVFSAEIKRKSFKQRLKTKSIGKTTTQVNYCWISFLNLLERYNKLEQSYQTLLEDNKELTSQLIEMYEKIDKKKTNNSN